MKIVRYENGTKQGIVYLDPERNYFEFTDKNSSYIDPDTHEVKPLETDEQKLEYFNKFYKHLLMFDINAYSLLKSLDRNQFEVIFNSVNNFLATLSDDDNIVICKTFLKIHVIINKITSNNILQVIDVLGKEIDQLDMQLDLCTKMEHFVNKYIPIPSLEDVGYRPQDSEAMTFRRHHVIELSAITILCKLLCPIFGQFFYQFKNNVNIDNMLKESRCAAILNVLFKRRYSSIILKFNNFLNNIAIQQCKNKDDVTTVFNGQTLMLLVEYGSANLFTRKLVSLDIYDKTKNLMTYATVCFKNCIDTQYRTSATKNIIKERANDDLKEFTSDEGNASRLENESIISYKPGDVPIIVEWTIEQLINKLIDKAEMPIDIYNEAILYYNKHIPPMTPVSNYLLCTYFGNMIDGAIGISMISAKVYIRLATILQYILIRKNFHCLVHPIMLMPMNRVKSQLTNIDNRVRMTWYNTYSYRNFKQKFSFSIGNRECDTKLKEMLEFLTTQIHHYNNAPVIWELMNESENRNNEVYQCSPDIMEKLCDFVNLVTEEEYR